uniref:Uncharacterized protein n=1 Tax=Romanomermis culicivorax TaxID=13658 RepID=A0A915KQZ0_ROMCU
MSVDLDSSQTEYNAVDGSRSSFSEKQNSIQDSLSSVATFCPKKSISKLVNSVNNNEITIELLQYGEVCLGCRGDCSDPNCTFKASRLREMSKINVDKINETEDCNLNKIPVIKTSLSYQEALKNVTHNKILDVQNNEMPYNAALCCDRLPGSRKGSVIQNKFCSEDDEAWTSTSTGSDDSDLEMTPARIAQRPIFPPNDADPAGLQNGNGTVQRTISCTSEEENTSERSNDRNGDFTTSVAMISSGSTMASSLERSLELAAMHSDGLSDKEKRVRQVKLNLYGHRRTGSGHIRMIPAQAVLVETASSAESEEATAVV